MDEVVNGILGLDISTRYAGWAIVSPTGALRYWGEVEFDGADCWQRIAGCHQFVTDKILHHAQHVDAVAVEMPASKINFKTLVGLSVFDGMALGTAMTFELDVIPVSVAAAKAALTRKGNATKEQMIEAARLLLCTGHKGRRMGEHAADATGVALAGLKVCLEKEQWLEVAARLDAALGIKPMAGKKPARNTPGQGYRIHRVDCQGVGYKGE